MIQVGLDYGGRRYEPIPLPLVGETGITEVLFTAFCRDLFIQVDLAGLNSGERVIFTVEGSLDNVGWDNLNVNNVSTTITTNGTTLIKFRGATPPYVHVVVSATAAVTSTATIGLQAYVAVMNP